MSAASENETKVKQEDCEEMDIKLESKVKLEGDEEMSSPSLDPLADENKLKLETSHLFKAEPQAETYYEKDPLAPDEIKSDIEDTLKNGFLTAPSTPTGFVEATLFFCAHCSGSFSSKTKLKRHFPVCQEYIQLKISCKKFKCTGINCKRSFTTKYALTRHITDFHSGNKFCCDLCNKTFDDKNDFLQHQPDCKILNTKKSYVTKEKRFTCNICSRMFPYKCNLVQHLHKHTGVRDFACDQCGKAFINKTYLRQHQRSHLLIKPFSCSICFKTFVCKPKLTEHLKTHFPSTVTKFQCTDCGKFFSSNGNLKHHRKAKHSEKKEYKCLVCNKEFNWLVSLRNHQNTHSDVRNYACAECGMAFKNRPNLKAHLQIHFRDTVKCFCQVCGEEFDSKISLRNHRRKHLQLNYSCPICQKRFSHQCYLDKHKETHRSVRPKTFKCKECEKLFSTKDSLTIHEKIHGDKQFFCSFCPKTFHFLSACNCHVQRVHKRVKRVICANCSKSFYSKSCLARHLKTHMVQ